MQIKKLKIKNFKGITDLEFSPKKFNIIVGRNNTGKTSILEAISIFADPDRIKFYCISHNYKYIQNIINASSEFSEITAITDTNKKEKIKISYAEDTEIIEDFRKNLIEVLAEELFEALKEKKKGKDIKTLKKEIIKEIENKIDEIIDFREIIQIVKENKKNIKVIKNNKKEIFYDPSIFSGVVTKTIMQKFKELKNKDILGIKIGIELNKYFQNKIDKNKFHAIMVKCGSSPELKATKDEMVDEIFQLALSLSTTLIEKSLESEKEKKEKLRKIEEIIKEYNLIENLDRLDLDYVSYRYPNKEDIIYIPFFLLGDGSKVMIYILWNLISTSTTEIKDKIILLDEPETNMHPGYILELLKMLIKFSNEKNIQFFISTHSGDFIDLLLDKENFSNEEQKFLKEEFLLLRMGKLDEITTAKCSNYEDAKYAKEELLLDLRGI